MKRKIYLFIILLILQVDAFAYAKKIVIASFQNKESAKAFSKKLEIVILKNKKLLKTLEANNISVNTNKINKYYTISIKTFKNKELILDTIKIIRKSYKDAYIQNTLEIPKTLTSSTKKTLVKKKKVKNINKQSIKKVLKKITKDKQQIPVIKEKSKIEKPSYKILSPINIMILIFFIVLIILIYYAKKFKRLYDKY